MILDVDGSPARPASPGLGRMLSLASAAVAAAALLVFAARPHDAAPRFPETAPSILEQAFARPKLPPTLELVLPLDVATEIQPLRVDGIYGPARPTPTVRSFRIRGSNAIVVVAMIPSAPAVVPPPIVPTDAVYIHGTYAANYSVEATSISAVRWTESGMTYEVSARGLLLRDVVQLAQQVR